MNKLLVCLLLCGCASNRETAVLAVQVKQSLVAAQALVGKPEQALVLREAVSAQDVVVARLSVGLGELHVPTTAEQAVRDTAAFVRLMAIQQGKAAAEVKEAEMIEGVKGDMWSIGLQALGGTGLVGAGVAKLISMYMKAKKEVADAVAAGEDLAVAKPEELPAVKLKHMKRQLVNGTQAGIAKALSNV